jgi:hypothetical protein
MSSVDNKLKSYSLAAAAVLAVQPALGAVVYTDIQDVTLSSNGSFLIDLNNDGINDFTLLFASNSFAKGALLTPLITNEVMGSGSSYFYPFALNANAVINANQSWKNAGSYGSYYGILAVKYISSSGSYFYGNWVGATDKFAGLRFKIGGNWHYGWVRLDIPSTVGSVTIKDFAYENVANAAILASATSGTVGIPSAVLPDKVRLFAHDRMLSIDLQDVTLTNASVSLLSVNGQVVLDERINGSKADIGLGNIKPGIYLARLTSKEGILSRKIYIE